MFCSLVGQLLATVEFTVVELVSVFPVSPESDEHAAMVPMRDVASKHDRMDCENDLMVFLLSKYGYCQEIDRGRSTFRNSGRLVFQNCVDAFWPNKS